jgi:hypothetical protein
MSSDLAIFEDDETPEGKAAAFVSGLEIAPDEPATSALANPAVAIGHLWSASTPVVSNAPALMQILPSDFPLPALIRFVPDPAIKAALDRAVSHALSLEVKGGGQDALAKADLAVTALSDALKAVDAHFEEPASIANQLHKQITGVRAVWGAEGKAAKEIVGRSIWNELKRLTDIENERRRQEQEEANRVARLQAEADAAAAEKNNAPKQVVEQLKARVETAVAPPVPVAPPAKMAGTSVVTTWKARIKGTPAEAEANPKMAELTEGQLLQVKELMRAIVAGTAPATCFEINWSVMNGRAKSDKGTMRITGFEAFESGGVRSKGRR